MEPRYNKPLCNDVLGMTTHFFYTPAIVNNMKKNLDITKHRYTCYSEQISARTNCYGKCHQRFSSIGVLAEAKKLFFTVAILLCAVRGAQ